MIYRAYAGGKEIKDFYIGGKETKEIWGGDNLLWEKDKDNITKIRLNSFFINFTYPAGSSGPGIKTEYMIPKATAYGIEFGGDIRVFNEQRSNLEIALAVYIKVNNDKTLKYNMIFAGDYLPGEATADVYVGSSKTKPYTLTVIRSYNFKQVENNIWAIDGKYEPTILLNEKNPDGMYLGACFPGLYAGGPGFHKTVTTSVDDAIAYVKSFIK